MIRPTRRSTVPRPPEPDCAGVADERPCGRKAPSDRGAATTLSLILLTPMMLVLGLAAFQAALWSHARTEVRVVARDTAALVARSGADPSAATSAAAAMLERDGVAREVVVTADVGPDLVTVVVRAQAPGMIRGTWVPLEVTVAIPVERWVP